MFAGTALSVRLLVYVGLSLFIIGGPYVYMVVCVVSAYNLTMEGLVSHLQRDQALKGQWICENCHKLYTSEKRLDNHTARCNKKSKTEVSSNSEETDVTDHD